MPEAMRDAFYQIPQLSFVDRVLWVGSLLVQNGGILSGRVFGVFSMLVLEMTGMTR